MVDKNEKNIIFSRLVTEIIEDKYDILFTFNVTYVEDNWSNLSVIFNINKHECNITQPINYETQKIIDLVEAISDKINKAIVNSYLK
jgi:hypothetical protein